VLECHTGTNLLQVMTHEIGHTLGLAHSDVPGAVMSPYFDGYNEQFRIGSDDILGIQALYGPRTCLQLIYVKINLCWYNTFSLLVPYFSVWRLMSVDDVNDCVMHLSPNSPITLIGAL